MTMVEKEKPTLNVFDEEDERLPSKKTKKTFEELCPTWSKWIQEAGGLLKAYETHEHLYGCCIVGEAHGFRSLYGLEESPGWCKWCHDLSHVNLWVHKGDVASLVRSSRYLVNGFGYTTSKVNSGSSLAARLHPISEDRWVELFVEHFNEAHL